MNDTEKPAPIIEEIEVEQLPPELAKADRVFRRQVRQEKKRGVAGLREFIAEVMRANLDGDTNG